jgi:DNA ligase-1
MKPQLARDVELEKLIFPCIVQPKIDGVRAMHTTGQLTGRSLDPFKGFGITEHFSNPQYVGLDGEMILGDNPMSRDRLCSATTGAMGRFKGVSEMADLFWYIFDDVRAEMQTRPYWDRLKTSRVRAARLKAEGHRLRLVPSETISNRAEAIWYMDKHLEEGFEGTIFRNPAALPKEGRPTAKGQELMRHKPWIDFEMLVTGVTEGQSNTNVAKTNTLGRTERSSAKAGMVPNGMIGSLQGVLLADVKNLQGEVVFRKGLKITAGSGEMTEEEARAWFFDQRHIVGWVVKVKTLMHGVKDLPRMPTFVSKRMAEDMSR